MRDLGQGSLEYLIILAAVLSISAIIVLFVTGAFGGQKQRASVASCREAASQCKADLLSVPDSNCTYCGEACRDPVSGDEVITDAIDHCKNGEPQEIVE